MTKIRSLDDLKQMRERFHSQMNIRKCSNDPESLPQIMVSMGTCGIAAGAKEVMAQFVTELQRRNIDAVVTQTKCMGYCNAEPVVEVRLPGREPILYGEVNSSRIAQIIDRYILHTQEVDGLMPTQYKAQS